MVNQIISTEELSQKITLISNVSEKIFLNLGKITPLFVKELHNNLILLEKSFSNQDGSKKFLFEFDLLFKETTSTINKGAIFFSQMHTRGNNLLHSLSASLHQLENLDEIINNIRNDSEDMALVSLNALTGAIKSGSAGRAFSVITDELKRLSEYIHQLTIVLQTDSTSLIKQLNDFTNELQKLELLQCSIFSGLDEKIYNQFSAIAGKIQELTESLYALVVESKGLEGPVSAVMETIQIQDIIRQSLDHIQIALTAYESIQTDTSISPEELQEFKWQLASLGEVIMIDVIKRLEAAVVTFETALMEIQKLIQKGEKQRAQILRDHFSTHSEHSVIIVFEEASKTLTVVEQNLSNYMTIKKNVASQGSRIADVVEILSKQYDKFDKMINRFKTVDIAARIEISKQSILRSIKDTVFAMSELIIRITRDVEQAKKVSLSFIEDTHNAILEYAKTYQEEIATFSIAQKELSKSFQQFFMYRENLEHQIRNFTLFSETFLKLLETQNKELDEIKQLVLLCKSVRDIFLEVKESIPVGTVHIEIKNQHLQELIKKFTIYAHKQAAAEIGNFEVSSSEDHRDLEIEASEVTFF
jgi:hypothetical protein